MKIIIVGCGNVGATLAQQLSEESHDIVVIDQRAKLVEDVSNSCDVLGVVGNGTSFNVQLEAGVRDADLLIAVTGFDELNLLCCLIAKKAGGCHTIARVGNPTYNREIGFIKEGLGLSMIINPQAAAAREMGRLLKFPSALKVDTFAKSRVELINIKIEEGSLLCNTLLKDFGTQMGGDILIPVVERNDEVIIPDGNFEMRAKDVITILGSTDKVNTFFKKIGLPTTVAKTAMIAGGGRTSIYLAKQMIQMGMKVKIIERDEAQCHKLVEMLPKAMIIHGDATDKELLFEEGLKDIEVFVAGTNFDEENIMIALYVKSVSKARLMTKIHRISYDEIVDSLDVGSTIYPKYIAAETILKYVRAMNNSMGSNIETLYRMNDNRVEALEFFIKEDSPVIGKPLENLKLKSDIIIGCITHRGKVSIAGGQSVIHEGDTVIVLTTRTGLHDIKDVLK